MKRLAAWRGDGGRLVHRGLLIALFLLLGISFVARGVTMVVDAHTIARDGATADGVVLAFHHTVYNGDSGNVYIGAPLFKNVAVQPMRRHKPTDFVKVRYLPDMAAEDATPPNFDAILTWILLGVAVLLITGWAARALYREQQDWARLETELLDDH
jgi:hypothetical protein